MVIVLTRAEPVGEHVRLIIRWEVTQLALFDLFYSLDHVYVRFSLAHFSSSSYVLYVSFISASFRSFTETARSGREQIYTLTATL